MGELRLPELGDRYNAAETYVDAHRAERPDAVAIRLADGRMRLVNQ